MPDLKLKRDAAEYLPQAEADLVEATKDRDACRTTLEKVRNGLKLANERVANAEANVKLLKRLASGPQKRAAKAAAAAEEAGEDGK